MEELLSDLACRLDVQSGRSLGPNRAASIAEAVLRIATRRAPASKWCLDKSGTPEIRYNDSAVRVIVTDVTNKGLSYVIEGLVRSVVALRASTAVWDLSVK